MKYFSQIFIVPVTLLVQVINAYITLLRAQDHLKLRACGEVLLENSLISSILKRDGDHKIKMEDLYPTYDENGIRTIEKRVLTYLDHDMVKINLYYDLHCCIQNIYLSDAICTILT
jgi:hypothetical protein